MCLGDRLLGLCGTQCSLLSGLTTSPLSARRLRVHVLLGVVRHRDHPRLAQRPTFTEVCVRKRERPPVLILEVVDPKLSLWGLLRWCA